ncbi:MAG: DUF3987 domain-containing protein, partial [Candidatus Neomicrothrix subdominans]
MTGPFGSYARLYRAAGWAGVLPLPAGEKSDPPKGFTGNRGAWPSDGDIDRWMKSKPGGNIAVRLPDGVVGIDVDAYHGGIDTLADLIERFGDLPDTWSSTSRTDNSGIMLYRCPSASKWPGDLGQGIESIRFGHRYMVAPPSIHPETQRPYRWFRPGGTPAGEGELPTPDELPQLPAAWVDGVPTLGRSTTPQQPLLTAAPVGNGGAVGRVMDRFYSAMASPGGRHDAMVETTAALVRLVSLGVEGADTALREARSAFIVAVADRSSDGEAIAEWERAVDGAAALIATTAATPLRERLRLPDERDPIPVADLVWTEPIPLRPPPPPPFPTDALPPVLRRWVEAHESAVQVPSDLPAVLALSALSAVAAGRATVSVGWEEPVNLYLAVLMGSGSRKSAVVRAALEPVVDLEHHLVDKASPAIFAAKAEQKIAVASEKEAAKNGDPAALAAAMAKVEEIVVPSKPRLLVNDATPEKLARLMAEQGRALAVIDDEAGVMQKLTGSAYGDSSRLDVLLKSHSTGVPLIVDRVGAESFRVDNPLLTIGVAVQPEEWGRRLV